MKLKSISFENYKAFYERQTMQLKPITILIGKNSSGKSSIAKLFTLLENSLSGEIDEPLLLNNNGVELGEDFENLFFGNSLAGKPISFKIEFENNIQIEVVLFVGVGKSSKDSYGLKILEWKYIDNTPQFDLKWENEIYFDKVNNNQRNVEFKGFIPTNLPNQETSKDPFPKIKIDVDYIGPFRTLPDRYFYLTGQTQFKDTGISGKNAYSMLGMSKLKEGDKLYESVGTWYKEHFDGWELNVDNRSKKPLIQILLTKEDISINLVDVGQGMNQALPLVVRANVTDRPDSIIVLEQPELHLHPAAHGDLAELFAKSAKENDQTFIIETHSENILLRLRRLIVENDFGFTKDDLIIYWIEDAELKGKELLEITVDEEGVFSTWSEDVFSESLTEILEMQKAIKRKEQKD
ncbi:MULTISPECIES: AAA family ATPase [unclassified Microcystis]|uniref:AAA family ATPase n=1 Tax=unclassified Microcystis TaxID=2643300 RepID=UPI00258BD5DD|nr:MULTISPECIES: AAA family ATPase [unclassified Microcystis]MCA6534948.1 AAA family ATPase [Pseudanabaena sp. M176S2SP2A07QC]MCA6548101.1 AAA family ATPase [Pseudanabaena sp. M152S2SP2A07QC]MCA6555435.1 AAA family ATPase [Pseudanabaena sp. M114S2SP2A07QC]MCA6563473.1 AAA family ATPase [Pseudanabaena sp. M151S2SP2A07QC]MCA6571546.1 AAA family ATPase [Pseudanabaena sp. M065S1SP2A07QC]MCA6580212.1 AAA family ATPase [Pseudanabaena sp. M085S1SP2A07QC]